MNITQFISILRKKKEKIHNINRLLNQRIRMGTTKFTSLLRKNRRKKKRVKFITLNLHIIRHSIRINIDIHTNIIIYRYHNKYKNSNIEMMHLSSSYKIILRY